MRGGQRTRPAQLSGWRRGAGPACARPRVSPLDGDGNDGWKFPDGRRVILLHPHQASEDVVSITRPTVNVSVLKPVGNVTLFGPGKQNGDEPEILAAVLDELILKLFVDVNRVEGPLVVLQVERGRGHRLVVLGTDDDDDQVLLLAEVPLHEVDLADTSVLLLKNVNMSVEAVVSQQSHKLDDLVDVLVVVGFVGDKHSPLLQRKRWAACRVPPFYRDVLSSMCESRSRHAVFIWIVRAVGGVVMRPHVIVGHVPPAEGINGALGTTGDALRGTRVRRQRVVVQLGRGWVGAQRQRLFQAHGVAAVIAREGRGLAPGQAALLGAAGVVTLAQAGRQAVGVARPAAGEARVEHVDLAWERGRLVVSGRQAVRGPGGAETGGGRGERGFLLSGPPPPAEHGVFRGRRVVEGSPVAVELGPGVRFVDGAGFSLLCVHGLIVLFRCVVAGAQLADISIWNRRRAYRGGQHR